MIRTLATLLFVSTALAACTESPTAEPDAGMAGLSGDEDGGGLDGAGAEVCQVTAPTRCVEPAPRYGDIEPILQERCVGCHAGLPMGPWALTSYEHVATWFAEIRGAMLNCAMPPPDAGISMPTAEREEILQWIRCGYPR